MLMKKLKAYAEYAFDNAKSQNIVTKLVFKMRDLFLSALISQIVHTNQVDRI